MPTTEPLRSVSDEPERLDPRFSPHDIDRRIYELRLRRVRLRLDLALSRAAARPVAAEDRERSEAELVTVEAELESACREGGATRREAHLQRVLELDDEELDLLWTVAAVAADPMAAPRAQVLSGGEARRGASVSLHATIAELGERSARDLALGLAVGEANPALRYQMMWPAERGVGPALAPLAVASRVLAFLAGSDELDEVLTQAGGIVVPPVAPLLDDEQRGLVARTAQALAATEPVLVKLSGSEGTGRRSAAAMAARTIGRMVLALDVRRLAPSMPALHEALAALLRECVLGGSIPLLLGVEDWTGATPDVAERRRAVARALEALPGPVVLVSSTTDEGEELAVRGRRVLRLGWPAPEVAQRQALWRRALGSTPAAEDSEDELGSIALRYRLGPGGIEHAVATARLLAETRGSDVLPTPRELVEGVRSNIVESLGGLARRVEVRQRWDDLVLQPDVLDQVRALIARVRHGHRVFERWGFARNLPRGLGTAALFSGPPGTGKTMVAGLIAGELDLDLYQVDLSKVVSKWVGETEKQLARIFEAAEAGHALLLFDEADSLFARRTEVKSAIDRYANLEVNYLLQRVESFGGMALLTTNLDSSIDPALRRRLAAHIHFWPPSEPERVALWRGMLPPDAPLADGIDLPALARRYREMTGANIRNAAIAAAFLAAAEETPITQAILDRAAKGEYRAMGHLVD